MGKGPLLVIAPASTRSDSATALAAVRRLSFAALENATAGEIHAALARELFAVMAVDQVHITRLASDRQSGSTIQYLRASDGTIRAGDQYRHPVAERSATLLVARTSRPFAEPDAHRSKVMDAGRTARFGAASGLFVPITFGDGPRSVATCITRERRDWTDEDIELAYTLADQCSASLAVLEMRTRLEERADREAALARAAAALNARLDLRSVLDTLSREANEALGGDITGVYLGDAEGGGLAVAGHGLPADSDWYGYVIKPGEGVGGQVLLTGQPAFSNSYARDADRPENAELVDLENAVAVPMRWNGELKGALSVGFRQRRPLDERDMESLQAMADLAAVACSNAEALERAEIAARTDSLTGLLNHGAVHVRLRSEIARVERSGEPLACVLLDLDSFKAINDAHGHLAGDQILQRVARALESEFRAYDGIGRFGGDEFALVFPGMDAEHAEQAARRVRELVAEVAGTHDLAGGVGSSVGVAQWHEPLSAAELLDRADRALLLAKLRGKHQIVVSSQQTEAELARREWNDHGPAQLLEDLWDMVSRCERPEQVLEALPGLLADGLELDTCVLVEPKALGDTGALLARLDGGAVARADLDALEEALGLGDLGVPRGEGAYAALPVEHDGTMHGLLVMRSATTPFPLAAMRLGEIAARQAVTALIGQSGGASRGAVSALAAAIDARDNYTHTHSEEVVALAVDVARGLSLPPHVVEQVRDGAMLHDVGKVAIPNEILYKAGPLDEDEWAVMREHPVIGERILVRTPELRHIAKLVRHEHERFDGGGYPDGLAGDDIPIASRIILACDAYNAMITKRPYRNPMSPDAACAELAVNAGTQFDPDVVGALLAVLGAGVSSSS